MQYISTRGGMQPQAFSQILLGGLAPDGGLVVPTELPKLDAATIESWRGKSYPDIAFEVISRFVDDIPADDLRALIHKTYTAANFGSDAVTPLKTLEKNLHILGLSYGPTLAFKDVAMQWLGNMFEYVLAREGREINIVGATSGDTGSAAEYAMRGKKGINVFMMSPFGKMSPFQRAQMFSLQDPNIHNLSVHGVFDQCQDMVKAVNNDAAFKAKYQIGAVNSINWGRVVAQIVYYFKSYFEVTTEFGQPVSYAVPSGNFGNVCAGHIARLMGLPIRNLIVATNENDVLDEFFRTGVYRPRPAAETHETSSPSMDISKASNLERFVFDVVGRDPKVLSELWSKVDKGEGFSIAGTAYFDRMIGEYGFRSGASSHADRVTNIREVFDRYGVEIDPHTADGYKAALMHREADVPLIILETALPAKFEQTMEEALGKKPVRPEAYNNLESLPQRFSELEANTQALKDYIATHVAAR